MNVSINAICRKDRINQNRTTNIYLRFTVDDRDFDIPTLKIQNPAVQLRIYERIEKYGKRIERLEALEVPA